MNNKFAVAIIILMALALFTWLVNYGWQNRYGSPETYEIIESESLVVNYLAENPALNKADIFADLWQSIPSLEVTLRHQITQKPWPKGVTQAVKVQAFHNGRDIFFRLTWNDDQADTAVSVDAFADGCAVAIPLDADAPVRSIMMGFSSPVNIWQWRADKNSQFWQEQSEAPRVVADFVYPFEEQEIFPVSKPELKSAVTDLLAERVGSLTQKETQRVQGRGFWREGTWNVVLKRAMTTDDLQQDCQFASRRRFVSFAVWDGDQGDRGARKSISEWVNLEIQLSSEKKTSSKKALGHIADDSRASPDRVSWLDRLCSFSLLATVQAADTQSLPAQTDKKPRLITLVAKRFEYTPNRIYVQQGELITIRMESLDVTHGLYMDGYGVKIKARPGLIGKVTFVADKTGRFSFRCSETCGEFHPYMIGFMEVSPNSRFTLFVWSVCIAFALILGIVLFKGKQKNGVETND